MNLVAKALVVDDDGLMRAILGRVFSEARIAVDPFVQMPDCLGWSCRPCCAYVASRCRWVLEQRLSTLSPREREVYELMVSGKTSKLIASELGGSVRTIEVHRARVIAKMQAPHLADPVRMAFVIEAKEHRQRLAEDPRQTA